MKRAKRCGPADGGDKTDHRLRSYFGVRLIKDDLQFTAAASLSVSVVSSRAIATVCYNREACMRGGVCSVCARTCMHLCECVRPLGKRVCACVRPGEGQQGGA